MTMSVPTVVDVVNYLWSSKLFICTIWYPKVNKTKEKLVIS